MRYFQLANDTVYALFDVQWHGLLMGYAGYTSYLSTRKSKPNVMFQNIVPVNIFVSPFKEW